MDSMTSKFDSARFFELNGSELVEFMEPLIGKAELEVSTESNEAILIELDNLDEYHLVYALELCVPRFPNMYYRKILKYLAHEEASVRLAVIRLLDKIPASIVNQEFYERFKVASKKSPDAYAVSSTIKSIEEKLKK